MKSAAANDQDQAALDQQHYDETLMERLAEYQKRHALTQDSLGKRLGSSGTYVNRYFNRTFAGDLAKFQITVEALLDSEDLTAEGNTTLVERDFSVAPVARFLNHVKGHGFIGIGHGPAGGGKTCGARIYAAKHPGSVYVHITAWTASVHALSKLLIRKLGARGRKGENRYEAIARVLKGSDRLLILDNAQRLCESTRRWICDLYDETQIPIALIGNPEIQAQWERNDQHGSRVGLCRSIVATDKTVLQRSAATLLNLHLPDAANDPEAVKIAAHLIGGFGAARAVKMHARLAAEMLRGGQVTNPAQALQLSTTQLIHQAA